MKTTSTLTLIIYLLLLKNISYGQMEKGSFFLGPQNLMELRYIKNLYKNNIYAPRDEKISEYSFSPIFGYFFMNNMSVGLIPSYQYKYDEIKLVQKEISNSISLTPFIRYYIGNKKFKPFLDLGISFKKLKSVQDRYYIYPNSSSVDNGFSIVYNFGAGVSYMISDLVSLDLGASFGYSKYILKSSYNGQDSFNYDQNAMSRELNIYLSLPFYFRCTKGN